MPITQFRTVVSADDSPDGDHTILIANAQGLAIGMTVTISALDNINNTETRTVTSISGSASTGFTIGLDSEVAYFHGQGSAVSWHADADHPLYEPRYRTAAAWDMNQPHKTNLSAILPCFDGWSAPREDGALVIYSGRYYAPTVTIGPDAITAYTFEEGIEDENACNEIVLTYLSAEHDYTYPACESWRDEDDIETRGRVASQTLENQVPSYTQARRLAKRQMARLMAPYRGSITTNQLGRMADGQRFINLLIKEAGTVWYDGPAEITALSHQQTGITFQWIAADPNIDSWDPATEEGEPAPVGNRVAGQPISAPTILSATANFGSDSATGTSGVFLDLTVEGAPVRDDVTWNVRTRTAGYVTWGERSYTDIAAATTIDISTEFVAADASIEVEVSYTVGDGRTSDWSTTATVNTSSASIPPAKVTGLAAAPGTGQATVTWNNPNAATLAYEKLYRSASPSFSGASIVDTYADPAGTASSHVITEISGTWYYFVTTVSSGGAEGNPVGPVSATVP